MSLRNVNPHVIVDSQILAVQAGLPRTTNAKLEGHYLAGGNVLKVTRALIIAHRARIELAWDTAAAIDLAGRDILEAVQTSVYPIVIDCPDPADGTVTVDGVSRDGIQLKARVRVTVRTNFERLIGGATQRTVIARVGQGIVTSIGSCDTYKEVLLNPQLISQRVLDSGLDAHTAYELVSIDIADINVGDNIGARLQIDQAEADVRVARANAEQRRALAMAHLQEMVALTEENNALVVLNEAEIPRGLAQAFSNYSSHPARRANGHAQTDVARYATRTLTNGFRQGERRDSRNDRPETPYITWIPVDAHSPRSRSSHIVQRLRAVLLLKHPRHLP